MAITLGGLATGMDTNALIDQLMSIERRPIVRLESERKYLGSRLDAFSSFDSKLKDLKAKIEALDSDTEVRSYAVTAGSDEFFAATADSTALPGSYQLEVKNLAQLQKDVSGGYASKTEAAFGQGTITINGTDITYDGDSLDGIMDKINAANTGDAATGVSASIINDGVTGYRLVLTGDDPFSPFTVAASESAAGAYAAPAFGNVQAAKPATILLDNIEIQSASNTFSNTIPGVSFTVNKANAPGETTGVTVGVDQKAIADKLNAFVKAYNGVVQFIKDQSDASWGKDSAFRSVTGRLQGFLTSPVSAAGSLNTLSQLGFKTEKDGTLTLDSTRLNDATSQDLESVVALLAGDGTSNGIAQEFSDYLGAITNSSDGILASRKTTTEATTRKIDRDIDRLEVRMGQREKVLRAQFTAMENLVAAMNSQSNYLAQQMTAIANLGGQ